MIEICGTYNTAICYADNVEESATEQITALCNEVAFANCKIRIMPDVHAGKGCTIGTTMTITDKLVPNMVGVDIGCGMETVQLAERELNFEELDQLIRQNIPCGRDVRSSVHPFSKSIELQQLRCASKVDLSRAVRSIGSLGGGNHFIEVDRSETGELFLVVHSGSRHLGNETALYYQGAGFTELQNNTRFRLYAEIKRLKAAEPTEATTKRIKELKNSCIRINNMDHDLAYVEGELFENYLHDMKLLQQFAALNRQAMVEIILSGLGLTRVDEFTTIHNYIDTEKMILRKGAVSAQSGERLLIPINMRDGSLICRGLGNSEWNCSAPHGAGRLMSRREASAKLSLDEYKHEMAGIYSTCVESRTLDESPMAYKSLDDIVGQIQPTAEIVTRIKPIYNFKAAE